MKKTLLIATAFALATLTGCVQEDSIGHGDIYIAGHNGKLCTGELKFFQAGGLFNAYRTIVAYCDNGVNIMDVKNVTIRSNGSKVDSTKFQEIFKE